MSAVAAEAMIERAGRALIDAASAPAKVILFGSHARGDADGGSDFDFLSRRRREPARDAVHGVTATALRRTSGRRAIGRPPSMCDLPTA